MYVQIKKSSLCRFKINQASGYETCVYSWYTSPHGSEQSLPERAYMHAPSPALLLIYRLTTSVHADKHAGLTAFGTHVCALMHVYVYVHFHACVLSC